MLTILGRVLLAWVVLRAVLVLLFLVHATPEHPAAWAAIAAIAVWAAFDAVAARALIRHSLLGRMMGFVSASLHSVTSYGLGWLSDDARWYAAVVGFAAIAALLSITPDER